MSNAVFAAEIALKQHEIIKRIAKDGEEYNILGNSVNKSGKTSKINPNQQKKTLSEDMEKLRVKRDGKTTKRIMVGLKLLNNL